MNVDAENFASTLSKDRATAIQSENGSIDAIRFANGAAMAWRCPGDANDRETHLGARMVRAVARAHAEIAKVQEDSTRSDAWKADEVARIAAEAVAKFDTERVEADKLIADFADADSRESVPQPLAPGDHVGISNDREIRDEVRKLDRDQQIELARELLEGKHPQTLDALLRNPWPRPGVLTDVLPEACQRRLLASDPHGARLRLLAVERVQWLGEITEQAQGALPRLTPTIAHPRERAIADQAD